MKTKLFFCLLTLIMFYSCNKKEYASYGSLYGIVTDSKTGDLLPNVTVILSPGGITKITGSDGLFVYSDLTPQQYTITVQKDGYSTNRKSISVVAGENIEANIIMTSIEK